MTLRPGSWKLDEVRQLQEKPTVLLRVVLGPSIIVDRGRIFGYRKDLRSPDLLVAIQKGVRRLAFCDLMSNSRDIRLAKNTLALAHDAPPGRPLHLSD